MSETNSPGLSALGATSLLLVGCLTIMVGCVIVPGLPSIAGALGVAHAASWLITLPSLGVVLFGGLASRIIQRIGLYRALCFGLFFYGGFGLVGVWMHGMIPVFADRLLLGGATAVVMASGTGLISEFYRGHERLRMIARQGMAIELGGVIFLSIGGVLATVAWFWPFALYLFAWLVLGMVWVFVPAVSMGHEGEVSPTQTSISLALKRVYIAATCSMLLFFIGVVVLPYRLHALGFGEAETGYFLSFISLVAVISAGMLPRMVRALNEYKVVFVAFLAYGAAHLIFAGSGSLMLMFMGAVLMGIGFGFSIPLVNHMTVELSHVQVRGRNLAYLSVAIFSGQFLSSLTEFLPRSFTLIFVSAAIFALVVGVGLWMSHGRLRQSA